MNTDQNARQKQLLGGIVTGMGWASSAEVAQALAHQRNSGRRIGELLLRRGCMTRGQLVASLVFQRLLRVVSLLALLASPAALADPVFPNVSTPASPPLVLSADRPAIYNRMPIAIPMKSLVEVLRHGLSGLRLNQHNRLQYEVDAFDNGGLAFRLNYRF